MDIVIAMVAIALILAFGGCVAFLWALRDGQFDDLETPALRILSVDDPERGDRSEKKLDQLHRERDRY